MTYEALQGQLRAEPCRWLVTGAAGFIGSHLVETLLRLGQDVVGLDNFSTGFRWNLEEMLGDLGQEARARFRFVEGDVCDSAACDEALGGVRHVLHQAALGSVPRSIEDPLASQASNVTGFVTLLQAARLARVGSFTYASSSAVYGDEAALPKVEERVGRPLSPYAASKAADELFAQAFLQAYGFRATGLRYFNVFGPRQDPEGPYAAVIPRWIAALTGGGELRVYGDGETSRDFCYVDNAVQANLLAALGKETSRGEVYNVAVGGRTTLNELLALLRQILAEKGFEPGGRITYGDFRPGDVRHSQADVGKARRLLGYVPSHDLSAGLRAAMPWYLGRRP